MKKMIYLLIGDPKKLFTPFNLVSGLIIVVGLGLIGLRLFKGLGAVTNLSQTTPWGLWIGFDVMCGVALAAGGYTIAATVHLFGLKEYEPLVRPAILTGFLGYVFVVVGLVLDLGQPWRMPLIMIFPRGVTSVLFEVGMCVAAYLTVQALEFVPAFWEWLQWDSVRRFWSKMTIWLAILGVVLSTLHQSSLGSLFLIAPTKLHPLR
jgi:Ni/Fe-hydrogenase subunit HybB-like protein